MTIIALELTRRIADSLILPFNIKTYAKELQKEFDTFKLTYNQDLINLGINLDSLGYSISNFTLAAKNFHDRLDLADKTK